MTIDAGEYNDSSALKPAPNSTCRLEKARRSFCDAPRWRVLIGDTAVEFTTRQLINADACWKRVFIKTHRRPPFDCDRDAHRSWLTELLAKVEEVSE